MKEPLGTFQAVRCALPCSAWRGWPEHNRLRSCRNTISCVRPVESGGESPSSLPRSLPCGCGAFVRRSFPRPPCNRLTPVTSRSRELRIPSVGEQPLSRPTSDPTPSSSRAGSTPSGEGGDDRPFFPFRARRPVGQRWHLGWVDRNPAERPVSRPGILKWRVVYRFRGTSVLVPLRADPGSAPGKQERCPAVPSTLAS